MVRLFAAYLTPFALTLLGFGLNLKSAQAQIIYPFETIQEYETTIVPITANISRVTNTGINIDAPYGLTNFINTNYSELNPSTGVIKFSPDPATFNLENLPFGSITYFGSTNNKLFGTVSGTGLIDFQNLVGNVSDTITITGGEGKFNGATGTLTFVENNTISPNPTTMMKGRNLVSGNIIVPIKVPESDTNAALIGFGLIGATTLVRRNKFTFTTKINT
ncbi:MAG: hypothetical protein KME29_08825 [Calothrix sp. FI2-JRJ7]|jgi:hypothetical protein|nr:hypothetical protein [Calothrix sp. FI2-JRJ7]